MPRYIISSAIFLLRVCRPIYQKDFPDALKHHFYHDLHKEVKAAEQAAKKFIALKPALSEKGVSGPDVTLALEGQLIAIIALFDVLKAQDKVIALFFMIVCIVAEYYLGIPKARRTHRAGAYRDCTRCYRRLVKVSDRAGWKCH